MANQTQNFLPIEGDWELTRLPMKASEAMEEGAAVAVEIVTNNVTGNAELMGTENALGADFLGIMAEPITSADSDYATAGKLKSVYVPKNRLARAEFTVGAGTFTAADVFKTVEIHSDSKSLAVDTIGLGARITKFNTSTRGECSFVLSNTETA